MQQALKLHSLLSWHHFSKGFALAEVGGHIVTNFRTMGSPSNAVSCRIELSTLCSSLFSQAIYMETLLKEEKKVWEEVDIVEFQASKLKKLQTGNPDSFQIIDSLAREVQSLNNSSCNQNTTSSNQIVDSQVLKELSSHELSASAS